MAENGPHAGERGRADDVSPAERALAERLRRDEQRLLADEARLAADEKALLANRQTALTAVVLAGTLAVAVAGLIVGLIALNRDIETVAKAAPKHNSVGTAALKNAAVTGQKLAPGSVGTPAIADDAVVRRSIARGAIGSGELAAGAVAAQDVRRNALTGGQIDEGTLRRVPAARVASRSRSAGDARTLAGLGSSRYVSRVRTVRVASGSDRRRTKGPLAARCPAGMRLLSGGAAVDGTSRGVAITRSAPNGSQDWVAVADTYRAPKTTWRLVVTALCAAGGK